MKWKKVYNYYLGSSAVMLALLLVMGSLVIYPAWHKIITIKTEIAAEKDNLEKKLDMGLNAKKIKEDLLQVENKLSILNSIFIPQGEELTLLSDIEALAAKFNVNVELKPDYKGVNVPGNAIRTPLEIKATGNFKNLMSFLNSLDSTDFYYIADKLNLSKGDKDNMSLDITGQVYVKTADKK